MIRRTYNTLAALLVRLIVAYCTARKRYVDYVHTTERTLVNALKGEPAVWVSSKHTYMRRYVLFGYRTGDPKQTGWRAWVPSLYLHHMHAPDADTALHNHPFPWGLSFVLLGGYVEERFASDFDRALSHLPFGYGSKRSRTHTAPAFNYIPGDAFHRVAELDHGRTCARNPRHPDRGRGVFTLFLAGPRRKNKPWGYLVPGCGYVDQKIRHAELEASEVRP